MCRSVALAADPPVNLGVAAGYAVLGGSAITNTGPSVISGVAGGDIGVAPGSSITGFPPGIVSGAIHSGDASATAAQTALTAAYLDAAGRPTTQDLTGVDLGGLTLTPGVYEFSSSAQLTGELILDGQGDPEALFVFKTGTTLTTASNSTVTLINGARFCRVFWQIGSSATLGTGTEFVGHILALTSITANTGANVEGQLLARNGAVTLDTNNITNGLCEDAATLHVIKNVVNDDGGTATASDFGVHVRAGAVDVYGSPQPGAESPGTTYTVLPGTYAVSEDASSAYSSSYSGDSDADGNITLLAGQVATVTITNNDVATGSVDITKRVRNLSGTTLRTGSVLLWTIVVTNDGEIPLTDVVVTDHVSGYTTYVKGMTGPGRDSRNVAFLGVEGRNARARRERHPVLQVLGQEQRRQRHQDLQSRLGQLRPDCGHIRRRTDYRGPGHADHRG